MVSVYVECLSGLVYWTKHQGKTLKQLNKVTVDTAAPDTFISMPHVRVTAVLNDLLNDKISAVVLMFCSSVSPNKSFLTWSLSIDRCGRRGFTPCANNMA